MSTPKYTNSKVEVGKVHRNVSQDVVVITVDRLRILITTHIEFVEKSTGWQAALGVFISLVAALSTADFKETFNVAGDVWKALFIIATIISFAWLVRGVVYYFKAEKIESLLGKITASDET
ncbi:hypothetical protein [Pseudomonas sp. UBA2684]|uniref:hypothetical protein n=1 Tax=Pseudomonas sp. UBA2684 TaxID=1947311 RepID=UPI0025D35759|nr:hypothetical protein [Pseudomonas sp. UBA2684]|tara:strand:- start:54 stop:416 length:363 start_codon:yes stop_codon:yes gene_type:complete